MPASRAELIAENRRLHERISSLFSAIAHGDEKHRAWLKEAIVAHFEGRPVPNWNV